MFMSLDVLHIINEMNFLSTSYNSLLQYKYISHFKIISDKQRQVTFASKSIFNWNNNVMMTVYKQKT